MITLLTSLSSFLALTVAFPTPFHTDGRRSVPPFARPDSIYSTGACLTHAGLNGTNVNGTSVNGTTVLVNATATEYSSNWAGAVSVDQNITSATGTFIVPRTRAPAQALSGVQYGAAAWVGIDGWTCGSGMSSSRFTT